MGCYGTSLDGVGWDGNDDICCARDNISDPTRDHGLGWGGVGMTSFCALDNIGHVGCYARSWVGVRYGDDDILRT